MDQHNIGILLAAKRREKNLTQEQLADRLGVSNKTISKWENAYTRMLFGSFSSPSSSSARVMFNSLHKSSITDYPNCVSVPFLQVLYFAKQ